MRTVIPRVHDYDFFSLKRVISRWESVHLDKMPIGVDRDNLDEFLLQCLAEEGVSFAPDLLEYRKLGLDLTPSSSVMGGVLKTIEEKHLNYVWKWEDNLFPEWSFWLKLDCMSIYQLVYLSHDISPEVRLDLSQPVYKYRTHFDEYLEVDQRRYFHSRAEEIVVDLMTAAVSAMVAPSGGLTKLDYKPYSSLSIIDSKSFVEWALSKGQVLPSELLEFTKSVSQNSLDGSIASESLPVELTAAEIRQEWLLHYVKDKYPDVMLIPKGDREYVIFPDYQQQFDKKMGTFNEDYKSLTKEGLIKSAHNTK